MLIPEHIAPDENSEAYQLLFAIETGLRELMIEVLSKHFGIKWWKQNIPSDVKDKAQEVMKSERNAKWSSLVPHHPIYYADFPDLKKIIIRRDNWKEAFEPIFRREEIISGTLSELEPIRNKIAHNRKVTSSDLSVVRAAYEKLASTVGYVRFSNLLHRCTIADDIPTLVALLEFEAQAAVRRCESFDQLDNLTCWSQVRRTWWFDEEYLNHPINEIIEFFEALESYRQLPRLRGQGHRIELWVKAQDISVKYAKAQSELLAIRTEPE